MNNMVTVCIGLSKRESIILHAKFQLHRLVRSEEYLFLSIVTFPWPDYIYLFVVSFPQEMEYIHEFESNWPDSFGGEIFWNVNASIYSIKCIYHF